MPGRSARDRGDDHVDVRLGIELAARVVLEHGIDEVARAHGLATAIAIVAARFGELLFRPGHGLTHREAMGGEQTFVARDVSQHAC